jgi:polyisoprenoid-binding protein YceI
MTRRSLGTLLVVLVATIALVNCTTTAPAGLPPGAPAGAPAAATEAPAPAAPTGSAVVDLEATYADLAASGGRLYRLDPQASAIRIHVFRAGRAAKLGHNHVLSAPRFTGLFHLPPAGPGGARFDLEFRLDALALDAPEHRAALGTAFAAPLSPEAIASTREHMLGKDNLQAEQYPMVRIRSLQITGEAPKFAARIEVEMHGRRQQQWVPLNVEGLPDRLVVTGALVLRQTDFGVQPYSVLGGMIAIQDEVIIEFKLVGG